LGIIEDEVAGGELDELLAFVEGPGDLGLEVGVEDLITEQFKNLL